MHPSPVIRFDARAVPAPWPDRPSRDVAAGSVSQAGCRWVEDAAHGIAAGLRQLPPHTTNWLDWTDNEFVILIEGEVVIAEKGRSTTFKPGNCFVLPRGLRCVWKQYDPVRLFFMTCSGAPPVAETGVPAALKLHPKVTLAPMRPPSREFLVTGEPLWRSRVYLTAAGGQFEAGIWDSTAYTRKLAPTPRHELMHLIEGEVTLTDAAGTSETFRAGDTFFVPLGATTAWHSTRGVRKYYCSFEPVTA